MSVERGKLSASGAGTALNVGRAAPRGAVFLSYASQDGDSARRICEALRAAGVEVWFDQSELVGGDAWDAKIRKQIAECALFVPVISANTQARLEGYFRLEWKLAAQRTHTMAEEKAFLLPVVIDETRDAEAKVPAEFKVVQWTRISPGGEANAAFCARVKKLLSGDVAGVADPGSASTRPATAPMSGHKALPTKTPRAPALAVLALALAAGVAIALWRPWKSTPPPAAAEAGAGAAGAPNSPAKAPDAAASIDPKGIAVLPFENLSAEPDSAYFADGMHSEVLTAVGKISALTVIGRTSVLPFAEVKKRNLRQIGAELGVASVIEGRVLRAGNQVKITVELVETQTGRQLWGETFERGVTDVFAIQAAIAQEVAAQLKAGLTANERMLIERRPTRNPVAYELYLRARVLEEGLNSRSNLEQFERGASAYQRVVDEDPGFALAYARLTHLHGLMFWFGHLDPVSNRRAKAEVAMQAAVRLAPDAPETHYAQGLFAYYGDNDWRRSLAHYERAVAGLPNEAVLLGTIGYAHRRLGHWAQAVHYMERAMVLNPRLLHEATQLADFLSDLRRFEVARQLSARLVAIFPNDAFAGELLAQSEFALRGDRAAFLRAVDSLRPEDRDPTGRHAEYKRAMWTNDLAAAERALADPRFTSLADPSSTINEPIALRRAMAAFLLGKKEIAARFGAEAIAEYGRQSWSPRQQPFALMGVALAKGFSGREDEAVREMRVAVQQATEHDAFGATFVRLEAGRLYAALGRRDEAIAALRELLSGPSRMSPNEIRIDPMWMRVADDPRFEEILKSAKTL